MKVPGFWRVILVAHIDRFAVREMSKIETWKRLVVVFFVSPPKKQLGKLGVLLDMKEDLDILLDLAVDVEVLGDSLADIDLSSPEDEELSKDLAAKELLQPGEAEGAGGAAEPSSQGGPVARAPSFTVSGATGASAEIAMSTLRNTTWEKDLGSEDTTEVRTKFFPFCFLVLRWSVYILDVECEMLQHRTIGLFSCFRFPACLSPSASTPCTGFSIITYHT